MQRTGLSQKLKQITELLADNSNHEDSETPVIERTRIHNPISSEYEARARRLALIKDKQIVPKYTNISNAVMLNECTTDWDDEQPGKRPNVALKHVEVNEENAALFLEVFKTIFENLSERTIAYLLFMAYNLRNSSGTPVFDPVNENLVLMLSSKSPEEFNNAAFYKETNESPVDTNHGHETEEEVVNIFNSCCFLAASYLRLLSKDAENYQHVGESLRETYTSFYKRTIALTNFHPRLQTLIFIKDVLCNKEIFKNTTYTLLYSGESCNISLDLKDFLYRKQISYTGLHCYTLFLRAAHAFSVDNNTLANVLNSKRFSKELDALQMLINQCGVATTVAGRKLMWRYARIYDSRFFSSLQTKNCPAFVGMLGTLLKKGAPSRANEDVMKIVHVKNLPPETLKFIEVYATLASDFLTYKRSDGHMSVIMEMM